MDRHTDRQINYSEIPLKAHRQLTINKIHKNIYFFCYMMSTKKTIKSFQKTDINKAYIKKMKINFAIYDQT